MRKGYADKKKSKKAKRRGKTLHDEKMLQNLAECLMAEKIGVLRGVMLDVAEKLDEMTDRQFYRDKVIDVAVAQAIRSVITDMVNENFFPKDIQQVIADAYAQWMKGP